MSKNSNNSNSNWQNFGKIHNSNDTHVNNITNNNTTNNNSITINGGVINNSGTVGNMGNVSIVNVRRPRKKKKKWKNNNPQMPPNTYGNNMFGSNFNPHNPQMPPNMQHMYNGNMPMNQQQTGMAANMQQQQQYMHGGNASTFQPNNFQPNTFKAADASSTGAVDEESPQEVIKNCWNIESIGKEQIRNVRFLGNRNIDKQGPSSVTPQDFENTALEINGLNPDTTGGVALIISSHGSCDDSGNLYLRLAEGKYNLEQFIDRVCNKPFPLLIFINACRVDDSELNQAQTMRESNKRKNVLVVMGSAIGEEAEDGGPFLDMVKNYVSTGFLQEATEWAQKTKQVLKRAGQGMSYLPALDDKVIRGMQVARKHLGNGVVTARTKGASFKRGVDVDAYANGGGKPEASRPNMPVGNVLQLLEKCTIKPAHIETLMGQGLCWKDLFEPDFNDQLKKYVPGKFRCRKVMKEVGKLKEKGHHCEHNDDDLIQIKSHENIHKLLDYLDFQEETKNKLKEDGIEFNDLFDDDFEESIDEYCGNFEKKRLLRVVERMGSLTISEKTDVDAILASKDVHKLLEYCGVDEETCQKIQEDELVWDDLNVDDLEMLEEYGVTEKSMAILKETLTKKS